MGDLRSIGHAFHYQQKRSLGQGGLLAIVVVGLVAMDNKTKDPTSCGVPCTGPLLNLAMQNPNAMC